MLEEFLVNRKFYVEVNAKSSLVVQIDRGCPQGLVWGPVLFNLYTGAMKEKLPENAFSTSYADDSYVVLHDQDQDSIIRKIKIEACLLCNSYRSFRGDWDESQLGKD